MSESKRYTMGKDLKANVRELEEQLQTLRKRSLIYEKALGAIADGFFIVARDGTVVEMNKAYCDYLGITREETLGKHITEVIYNTKMIDIMDKRVTEIDTLHQFVDGQTVTGEKMIAVSRMPVMDGDEVIASVALVKFSRYTIMLADNLRKLEEEVAYYRNELRKHGLANVSLLDIPCASPPLRESIRLANRFAASDLPILLLGETGVGKDVFANAIHHSSFRRNGPFISVNCASIPAELLESEFFGYTEGAFTGSRKGGKKGKFELADGGTLFLDEIGDMPLALQGKLLRVLQTQEVEKIGSEKSLQVNVRILTATNQDLERKVREKLFREDLLYRLNVLSITIPPLRERTEDIPMLVTEFVNELNVKYGRTVNVAPDAMLSLTQYDWPGNVRELRNVIGRGFMLAEGDVIQPHHLPASLYRQESSVVESMADIRHQQEKEMIMSCLASFGGNMSKAAKALGMHRSTLYAKLELHGISGESFRQAKRR